jgi:2-oxo-4-hydroxy-4-carboxy-5-ureidoimidazoline decarboxylase
MKPRQRAALFGAALAISIALSGAALAQDVDMAAINALSQPAFVAQFGGVFEKSPWVAQKAWERRPFVSVDAMHAAMIAVVKSSPLPSQLALLQSHPDLAGKEAQSGTMTSSSAAEQSGAGLNALTKPEMASIAKLNAAYRQKFGFPFIIAVRLHTKEGIFFDFSQRLANDTQTEYFNDLQNVYAISRLRLAAILTPR